MLFIMLDTSSYFPYWYYFLSHLLLIAREREKKKDTSGFPCIFALPVGSLFLQGAFMIVRSSVIAGRGGERGCKNAC